MVPDDHDRDYDQTLEETIPGQVEDFGAHDGQFSLVIFKPEGAEVTELSEGSPITIGRAPPSDVMVLHGQLSRQHARFRIENGHAWVEDLGSTNGTQINGRKIDQRTQILPGDVVSLAGTPVHVLRAGSEYREQISKRVRKVSGEIISVFEREVLAELLLPPAMEESRYGKARLQRCEQRVLQRSLDRTDGDGEAAARALGLSHENFLQRLGE